MNLQYSLINQSFFSRISKISDKRNLANFSSMLLVLLLFSFVEIKAQSTIGNSVFRDLNGNGLQDDGANAGINGLTIALWQPGLDGVLEGGDDIFVSQQVTANDINGNPGFYAFTNVPAGLYYVKFPTQNGRLFVTTKNDAPTIDFNSNANRFTGYSAVFSVQNGVNNLTIDAGYSYLQPLCPNPCDGQFVDEHIVTTPFLDFDIVNEPLDLPQFDPNLGTLKRVELESRLTLNMRYAFENYNTVPRTVSLSYFDTTSITGPGLLSGGNFIFAQDTLLSNFPLSANNGVTFSGADYITDSLLLGDLFSRQVTKNL